MGRDILAYQSLSIISRAIMEQSKIKERLLILTREGKLMIKEMLWGQTSFTHSTEGY